jgi:hypothetical protein
MHRPPLPPGNIPGTHFCYRLSRPQGHSAAGSIMPMKNDTIGNRTRNLPVCSEVPQPTAPPRAPRFLGAAWELLQLQLFYRFSSQGQSVEHVSLSRPLLSGFLLLMYGSLSLVQLRSRCFSCTPCHQTAHKQFAFEFENFLFISSCVSLVMRRVLYVGRPWIDYFPNITRAYPPVIPANTKPQAIIQPSFMVYTK